MPSSDSSSSTIKTKVIATLKAVILAVVLFFSSGVTLPWLDTSTQSYFRDSIGKAGISYGICRIVNGTVTVVKESTLELEPGGIGMSLAIGQLVDPINDMVERLSDVLVMAITSLGIQELVYQIGIDTAPLLLAFLCLILGLSFWVGNSRIQRLQKITVNIGIIIFIARFFLPLSSLANNFLQNGFFEERITVANAQLDRGLVDLEGFEKMEIPAEQGWLGSIESSAQSIKKKSSEFRKALASIAKNKDLIIDSMLQLTLLYLGIFVIQVLVLPLLSFWLLAQIVRALLLPQPEPLKPTV